MASQIVGNLLGAFVLGSFNKVVFFVMMSIISFLGALTFLFLKKPIQQYELLSDPQGEAGTP